MDWREAQHIWGNRIAARSRYTAHTYGIAVSLFARSVHTDLGKLSVDDVEDFSTSLALRSRRDNEENKLSTGSANKYGQAVRMFLIFASKKRWVSLSEAEIREALPPIQSKVQRPYVALSREEQDKLLSAASCSPRDYVLVVLGLGAGLRAMELSELRKLHLKVETRLEHSFWFVEVDQGKGRRDRRIPVSQDTYQTVMDYAMLLPPEAKLLALSPNRVLAHVHDIAHKAGIERRVTTHTLRHTFANNAIDAGATPAEVAYLLGDTIQAALIYINHVDESKLARLAPSFRSMNNGR